MVKIKGTLKPVYSEGIVDNSRDSPRIGEDYQANMLLSRLHQCRCKEGNVVCESSEEEEMYAIGLPIPIAFLHLPGISTSGSFQLCNGGTSSKDFEGLHTKEAQRTMDLNSLPDVFEKGTHADMPPSIQRRKGKKKKSSTTKAKKELQATSKNCKPKIGEESGRCIIIPGEVIASWNGAEEAAFALGFYLFGRDFQAIKKFLGSRQMKDILVYYYGKFRHSLTYETWSTAQRNGSKRRAQGRDIVSGWRQKELIKRLTPHVGEEVHQRKLLEATASYNNNEFSLMGFVSTLRDIVGLELFVESIGLFCAKRDLTTVSMDAARKIPKPHQLEMPVGKDLSKLTPQEILNVITGCRLSKTKAQDLFWEAVWPCLLGKGWHSEENKATLGTRSHLVFLMPSVIEFSKNLIKGEEYFDSITEVLDYLVENPSEIEVKEKVVNDDTENHNGKLPSLSPDESEGDFKHGRKTDGIDTLVAKRSPASEGNSHCSQDESSPPIGITSFRRNYSHNIEHRRRYQSYGSCIRKAGLLSIEALDDTEVHITNTAHLYNCKGITSSDYIDHSENSYRPSVRSTSKVLNLSQSKHLVRLVSGCEGKIEKCMDETDLEGVNVEKYVKPHPMLLTVRRGLKRTTNHGPVRLEESDSVAAVDIKPQNGDSLCCCSASEEKYPAMHQCCKKQHIRKAI